MIEPIAKSMMEDLIRKHGQFSSSPVWLENYLDPTRIFLNTLITLAEAECSKKIRISQIKEEIVKKFGTGYVFTKAMAKLMNLENLTENNLIPSCTTKCCENKVQIPFFRGIVNAGFLMLYLTPSVDFGTFLENFAKLNHRSINSGVIEINWSMLDLDKDVKAMRDKAFCSKLSESDRFLFKYFNVSI